MALAESTHHAAARGQKKSRAGERVRDAIHDEVPEALLSQEPGLRSMTTTVCWSSGAPGLTTSTRSGRRSGFSSTPWTIVDTAPAMPILDVPVPLMVDQHVPKITLEDIPARRLCREPQHAEQLVDEPVPSFDDFELAEEDEEEEQPRMVPGSRVRDAHGRSWCRVAGLAGVYWWMIGTSTAQYTPGRDHRQAREVYKYWPPWGLRWVKWKIRAILCLVGRLSLNSLSVRAITVRVEPDLHVCPSARRHRHDYDLVWF